MRKKGMRLIIGLGLLLMLGGCRWAVLTDQPKSVKQVDQIPTFYLHGWGGTANSTNQMIRAAIKDRDATKVLVAKVNAKGKVSLIGDWRAQTRRPIIQVIYQNNKQTDYRQNSAWFKNVLVAVNRQHHFKQFNVVAHSMGNLTLAYYLLQHAQNKQLPQLAKAVDIAGHYDGILGMDDRANQNQLTSTGQPVRMNATYRQLLALRQVVPKQQIQILNIYGDLGDGSHSDGRVSNVSSRSLAYLMQARAKSYREVKITGKQAQHSALHANAQVDQQVLQFLWPNAA